MGYNALRVFPLHQQRLAQLFASAKRRFLFQAAKVERPLLVRDSPARHVELRFLHIADFEYIVP